MRVEVELLPGCLVLTPRVLTDERGQFVKTFHAADFAAVGLALEVREEFFSVSRLGVLRGMHLQVPPQAHEKLVYCIVGAALDVVLDLRRSSPSFGQTASIEISAQNRRVVFVPKGVAHGFLALQENTTLVYKTSTVHAPDQDTGVRWDSFGFDWPVSQPVISARDQALPLLAEFVSPFP
jgi:dTDP-4-dehydrorhamnose 3,5-epimerase/CDP-3, 6-dideoxy-D-glycero-D-glycero-4-hexulose-5-epimerase